MSNNNHERIPVEVLASDTDQLRGLAGVYDGFLQSDVKAIADDVVPEVIEISNALASKIEAAIGKVGVSDTILIVGPYEKKIIEDARRISLV